MAEIGLVRFARVAREVAEAVVSPYRTKFSKQAFTQPQLLAVLCLMRYEDWTLREAEVRLSEHRELREALGLRAVPDYTTLHRFLKRLSEDDLTRALNEIARRMPGRGRSPATVAVDATGLAQTASSSYFVRRIEHFGGQPRAWKHWLKWLAVVDVDRQIILAQSAREAPWNDCANLPALVRAAHAHGLRAGRCRIRFRAQPCLLPRGAESRQRDPGQAPLQQARFRCSQGHARELSTRDLWTPFAGRNCVSAVKRKLSARAPGRSMPMQGRQALLLGLAYNLYRLRARYAKAGCQQSHCVSTKARLRGLTAVFLSVGDCNCSCGLSRTRTHVFAIPASKERSPGNPGRETWGTRAGRSRRGWACAAP